MLLRNENDSANIKVNQSIYRQLTKKISNVNKRLLNSEIRENSLKKLEKDRIRGEGLEKPEPKLPAKNIPKLDLLSSILKTQVKVKNTQAARLPKMPFGKHASYNEESVFVPNSFSSSSRDSTDSQNEKFKDVMKKFKLDEKRKPVKRKEMTGRKKCSYLSFFDTFDMEHGELFCEKNFEISDGYSRDKEKCRNLLYSKEEKKKGKSIDRKSQVLAVERLSNLSGRQRSELETYYLGKYQRLFSRESSDSNRKAKSFSLTVDSLF